MDMALPRSARYDTLTIRLHWATALLVVVLWSLGQTIDAFPRGDARIYARSTHIALGVLLGVVLLWRLWWRARGGEHLPVVGSPRMSSVSTWTHRALYLLLIATVILGIANAKVRGDNLFNWFTIPAFAPGDRDLRKAVGELHELTANTLLIVAGLHAAAALLHHFVMKDDVLRRMLPSRRTSPNGSTGQHPRG